MFSSPVKSCNTMVWFFKIERVEKRRVMRVKLEIVQTDGEGELKDELDRARSGT